MHEEQGHDRIGGSTPTIPRSDDNKDAMIHAIALSQKARKERRFRTYLWGIDVSGKAGPSHYRGVPPMRVQARSSTMSVAVVLVTILRCLPAIWRSS